MHILVRELAERRLPVIRNNPRLGWAAALGLFALAFVLRWVLEGILPVGLPFITFFIAILLATSRRKNEGPVRCGRIARCRENCKIERFARVGSAY